ncbi:hypothetical protein ACF0H5_009784 [Mactra antiquata]
MVSTPKLVSGLVLFGISILCGTLACVCVKWLATRFGTTSQFKRIIGFINCFSGGVFFATCLLNLLPEARESMENALELYDWHSEYPFTELALGIGFFLIMAMEHISYSFCGAKTYTYTPVPGTNTVPSLEHKGSVAYSKRQLSIEHKDPVIVKADFEDSSGLDDVTYQNFGAVDTSADTSSVFPYATRPRNETPTTRVVFAESDQIVFKNSQRAEHKPEPSVRDILEGIKEESVQTLKQSKIRGIVLLAALSLHMIFDGLALGLLKSDSSVWTLLAALSLHKALVFITIGMQTYEILATVNKSVLVILVLSLVSPLGILIGESINSGDDPLTREMLSAILQGIATGTFLFVTFFEILQHELGVDDHDIVKVIISVFGFILVAGIRIMEHEDH